MGQQEHLVNPLQWKNLNLTDNFYLQFNPQFLVACILKKSILIKLQIVTLVAV